MREVINRFRTEAYSRYHLTYDHLVTSFGMKVVLADNDTKDLPTATAAVEATSTATGSGNVLAIQCDVSKVIHSLGEEKVNIGWHT